METKRVIKVRRYQQPPGAAVAKPIRPVPWTSLLLPLAIGFPLVSIVVLYILSHWTVNPPDVDLSRRVVFALASLLGLYAAGMMGFAFGIMADRKSPKSQPEAISRGMTRRRRSVLLITVGTVLLIISGWFEYLTLFDRIP